MLENQVGPLHLAWNVADPLLFVKAIEVSNSLTYNYPWMDMISNII